MADSTDPLFQQINDQTNPTQPGVFENIDSQVPGSDSNRYSPEQTKTTAGLGALAQQNLGLADTDTASSRLSSLMSINQDRIQQGKESQVRSEIMQADQGEKIKQNLKLQSDIVNNKTGFPSLFPLTDAVNDGFRLQGQTGDPDSLETRGIGQLQAMSAQDPDQAALLSTINKDGGSLLGQMRDNATKIALFAREVDALNQKSQNEPWYSKTADVIEGMLPTLGLFSRTGNVPGANTELTDTPSTRENKEATTLWNLPLDEFKKQLPSTMENFSKTFFGLGNNPTKGAETAQSYYSGGLNNSDSMGANFWDAVDVANVIPVGTFVKIARSASKVARIVGNRVGSTEIVAGDLAKDIHGVADPTSSIQDGATSIEESLPSSVAAGATRPDVGIPADVARQLNDTRATVQAVLDTLPKVSRLEPNQLQIAVEQAIKDAHLRYTDEIADTKQAMETAKAQGVENILSDPEADLDNLSWANARGEVGQIPDEVGGINQIGKLSQDKDSGIYSLNLYLGKKNSSGGFLSQEGADAAATRKGLGSYDLHQNDDGQWFVKVQHPVTETGIAQPNLTKGDFKGLFKPSMYFKNFDNVMPDLFNRNRITQTLGKSSIIENVYKPYVNNIKALSLKSRRLVAKVAALQESDHWFTQPEFEDAFIRGAGRLPTKKETLAFHSGRELNDLNYHMFNNEAYIRQARDGVETGSINAPDQGLTTGKMNVRVIQNPNFDNLRVWDAQDGKHYPPGTGTDTLNEKMASGKYRVLDLQEPQRIPGSKDPIQTVIAHESQSTIEPLLKDQLPYVAGGSRENRFRWFTKQANSGTFEDGSEYWMRPITHVASRTFNEGDRWGKAMEEARLAYVSKTMTEAEKRLVIDKSPAESYDRFDNMVKNGQINLQHPFETLFDKQRPTAMSKLGQDGRIDWSHDGESAQEGYNISRGSMYYSKKGDRLNDPSGDLAEILDPYTTLNHAMDNASQTNAFGDYNRKVVEEWSRVASPYLAKAYPDPVRNFFEGKLDPDLLRSKGGQQFNNQLEMTRNVHQRFMYGQNPDQRMTYTAMRRFADWAESKDSKFGNYLAGKAYDKMSSNPISAAKGLIYDLYLGFGNLSRLWLHTQTSAAAISVHPLYGGRAAAMTPWLTHYLLNASDSVANFYGKGLKFVHGLESDDWVSMAKGLKDSGWLNVSGEQMQLDRYMGHIGGSVFKKGLDNIRQWGRVFQNTSELFNRVTAYQIAWHKMRDQFPELAGSSPEFQQRVNYEASSLDNNMTSASQAWWQRGPASVPTQFMAYQTRMIERLLPKEFGGSNQLSLAQKGRLLAGQVILFGVGGLPAGTAIWNYVTDQYAKANNGKQMDADTQREFGRGVYDTALHSLFGVDTDISSRAGLGAFTKDLYEKMTDGSMNPVLRVVTGPLGDGYSQWMQDVSRMSLYMHSEQYGALDAQNWQLLAGDAAKQMSSVNNGLKAYWVWKTGQLRDPKTGELITNEGSQYVITHALGIPSYSEVDRWDLITKNENQAQNVKDLAKVLTEVRRNAIQAIADKDPEKQQYYNNLVSGIMQQFDDPTFKAEVAAETNKSMARAGFNTYDMLKIQSGTKLGVIPQPNEPEKDEDQ